ncbi:MAG: hypothetical protein HZB16_00275 [Armatimonadetes bacterium]|nr:hypothetical protein [Armatimonadota bacterium]
MGFWDRFGDDYRRNCLAWRHAARNPVIPAAGDTWKCCWTANPDVLEFGGRRLLYYRGNGVLPGSDGQRHDRLAVAELVSVAAHAFEYRDLADGQPIVDVGAPGSFDCHHALDPAAAVFGGEVLLYYSAIGDGPDRVGLARSRDGEHFEKVGCVLTGRAPEVVVRDGHVHMLYQLVDDQGRYELHLARSADGLQFERVSERPVFAKAPAPAWDSFDVATGRVFVEEGWYYLIYGGSASLVDQPDYFGVARSRDLLTWERHPGNPIFGCGPRGSEDGGAIWFPALIEAEDCYALLYEGSRGNYQFDLSSQICLATLAKGALRAAGAT